MNRLLSSTPRLTAPIRSSIIRTKRSLSNAPENSPLDDYLVFIPLGLLLGSIIGCVDGIDKYEKQKSIDNHFDKPKSIISGYPVTDISDIGAISCISAIGTATLPIWLPIYGVSKGIVFVKNKII